ncbi:MAG: hypothetical protein EOO14_04400 [Chitinophagaceae bacterium]|nr:MAG: hypothetical protein EOO14_04400 [Chitinophagaceae bacterium]
MTLTFGNTKAIDLLIEKDDKVFKVQVKGIQRTKSICWTIDKTKISDDTYYILINLHVDQPTAKPEFFVLTGKETKSLFKNTKKVGEKRAYLDYNKIKNQAKYRDRWNVFGKPDEVEEELITMKGAIRAVGKYANGSERFEIPLKDVGKFPVVYNKRLSYTWTIGGKTFIIGLRFTNDAGGWFSPYLYDFNNPDEKTALSQILLKNGFSKNKKVEIFVDLETKEIEIIPV